MFNGNFIPFADLHSWVEGQLSQMMPATKAPLKGPRAEPSDAADDTEAKPKFESVAAACAWVDACRSTVPLPEPSWYAMGGIVGRCEGGEAIFHEMSAADNRYSPAEASDKLARSLEAGPRTCQSIADQLGFEGCASCVFRGKITTPLQLGRLQPSVARLMRDHVMVTDTRQYFELASGVMTSAASFNDKHRHVSGGSTPHNLLSPNPLTRKVDRVAYLPGVQELLVDEDGGRTAINIWRPGPLVPTAGACDTVLDHLNRVIPDDEFRNHLLNCLAVLVQKPGQKIGHAIVLIGKQGTGKSLTFQLVRALVGSANHRSVESDFLNSKWSAYMANFQVISIEEMMTFGSMETYNRLKPWITERETTVEEKGIQPYRARTPDLFLAATNLDDPISIEAGDRRFAFYRSPMDPQTGDYYEKLAVAIESEAPAFLGLLLGRDISGFNPGARPPTTSAKDDIVKWSLPLVTQEVEAMADEGAFPFWGDLLSIQELREAVYGRLGTRPSMHKLTKALQHIGAARRPPVRTASAGSVRLWAWRNIEYWQDAEPDEVRQHWVGMMERRPPP
jgi:hypothetical protein